MASNISSHYSAMGKMPPGRELFERVPDEIYQLVESFRKFIREQKAYRDQKISVDPILEVDREIHDFTLAFERVSLDQEINNKLIQQIKNDTSKLLLHAQSAYSVLNQQQQQLPQPQPQDQQPQQPLSYFSELADEFHSRMKAYGDKIRELKMSLDSILKPYNYNDIFKLLKKHHEMLGEIAAQVYMTHERIMNTKNVSQDDSNCMGFLPE